MAVKTLWPRRTSSPREKPGRLSSGGGGRRCVPPSSSDPVRMGRACLAHQNAGSWATAFPIKAWGKRAPGCRCSPTFLVLALWPGDRAAGRGPWELPRGCPIPLWSLASDGCCCCCAGRSGQLQSRGLVCKSFHRPGSSFMFSNEYAAKISIKLPETLKFPHRRHNRDGEGSQLTEVTMLF